MVSPGVPLNTPELVQVRNLGLPIIGELELAARFLKGEVLAITGSNGKTTTTTLCGEIFSAGGLQTLVAGNIGLPVIETVDQSKAGAWSVLEVSSFQLETTESFHPRIAMILNITPDHLDRHGTFENYVAMKEKIFANQTGDDYLILNGDDPVVQQAASRARSQVLWFSRSKIVRRGAFLMNGMVMFRASEQASPIPIVPLAEIPLKGEHNIENVLAAVCAACVAKIPAEVIGRAVASFHAVEHRLEFVATIHGVDYYNDSKATNVDATAKAIASFPGNIHLILGGKDKNSDYTQLNALLQGAGQSGLHHRLGGGKDRRADRRSHPHHSSGYARSGCQPGGGPGSGRRCGPAGACLLQLRPVRKLRTAGKGLQASSDGPSGGRRRSRRMAKRVGVDKWLFGVTVLLTFIGLLMIFSASAVMAEDRYGSPYKFVSQQVGWAVLGLVTMTLLMRIDYRKFNRPIVVFPAVAVTTLLLLGVFLLRDSHNTHRWIRFCRPLLSAVGDCQARAGALSGLVSAGQAALHPRLAPHPPARGSAHPGLYPADC